MNTLKIKDREFKIISASISEKKDAQGNNRWDISIKTEGEKFDGEQWAPSITGENMKINAPDLDHIEGQEITIGEAYNHDTDEYLMTMYVFEHEDVWDSKIKFLSRKENKLEVKWTGKCNIHFNNEYGKNVPFEIDAEIEIIQQ